MYSTSDRQMINIIREYRAELPIPISSWPDVEFDKVAYSMWAADELLVYVLSHMDWSVMKSVVNFKNKMLDYSCIANNNYYTDANFQFDIAYDVACDIEERLNAML